MWQPLEQHEIDRVFTTESRQKDERLFSLTHTPMKRILVTHNRTGLDNNQFIGEHQLLEVLQQSHPGQHNRVWFLVGETGSGKSELCQWLEYHLADTHVPIHISRRHANLTGILDVLNQHLPLQFTVSGTSLPPEMLADHLRMSLQLRAYRENRHQSYVQDLLPSCETLVERLYSGRGNEVPLLDGLPTPPPDLPLQAWLQQSVREVLGVQSLEQTLRAVVEHYQARSRRPVLLLEDITTLGFLRDDLLDYIFDLSAPGFDTVIGLTNGFEQSHLGSHDLGEMAYVRDRLSGRFQLSHSSGETYFLNQPQDLHEMVRRYLACLSNTTELDAPAEFAGLYPFSPVMIDRLYLQLVESGNARQTPRNLLDAVIRPSLSGHRPPHESLFQPHPYLRPPSITFYHQQLTPEQTALFFWHGVETDGELRVPPAVAQAFGFRELPAVQTFRQPVGSAGLFPHVPQAAADDSASEWQVALTELQQWRSGHPFPKRQVVKRGVERIVRILTEPRLVAHPHLSSSTADPLEYYRGSENLPIYMPGSGDILPEQWPSVTLEPTLPAQFLEECLTYGLSAATHIEVFSDVGHTRELAQKLADQLQEEMRRNLEHLLGMTIEQAVLGMWWVTQHLTLSEPFFPAAHSSRDLLLKYDVNLAQVKRPWQAERANLILSRTQKQILEHRHDLRALFISLFHHRDDFLDAPLLERHWSSFDPVTFITTFGKLNCRKLKPAPYRQQSSKISLHDLAHPIQEFCAALTQYAGAEGDISDWEVLGLQLEDVLQHVDEYDRLCREIQNLAQQLGFAVQAPSSSYQWRSAQWATLLKGVQARAEQFLEVPPITTTAVIRAWNEYLIQTPPLVWRAEVRKFYVLVHNMLVARDGGQRLSPRQTVQQPLSVQDLQQLAVRLRHSASRTETVSPELRASLRASLERLLTIEDEDLLQVARVYHEQLPEGKDDSLRVACELLDQTTRYVEESLAPLSLLG